MVFLWFPVVFLGCTPPECPGIVETLLKSRSYIGQGKLNQKGELETSMDINIVYAYINTFMYIYIYL